MGKWLKLALLVISTAIHTVVFCSQQSCYKRNMQRFRFLQVIISWTLLQNITYAFLIPLEKHNLYFCSSVIFFRDILVLRGLTVHRFKCNWYSNEHNKNNLSLIRFYFSNYSRQWKSLLFENYIWTISHYSLHQIIKRWVNQPNEINFNLTDKNFHI